MKRLLPGFLVIMGFLTGLVSCNPPERSRYVLLNDMAYEALASKTNPDSTERAQMEALRSAPSAEDQFGSAAKDAVFCCCPCPTRTIAGTNAKDTTHCPCPDMMEMRMAASDKVVVSIEVDGTQMEASDPPAGDSLKNVKIYQLPKTTTLADGTHELTIKGDLTGSGVNEYKLVFETIEGKPYKKSMKE